MRIRSTRFDAALLLLLLPAIAGCGGGGGSSAAPAGYVPAVTSTVPPSPSAAGGPVSYLQSTGPLSSSGNIAAGSRQALVAVMSGAGLPANGFANDTILVSSGSSTQSSTRAAAAADRAAPRHALAAEAFPANDAALLRGLSSIASSSAAAGSRARMQSVVPAQATIGTTASIWVQQGSLSSGTRINVRVPATLLAQSAHGNVWIDDSLLSGTAAADAFAAGELQSTLAQIAADFENAYASDVAHFASFDYASNAPGLQPQYQSCSSSGSVQGNATGYITEPQDRRINVMVVNPANLGGMGGYFSGSNYLHQAALNCLNKSGASYESNEAPFIFVGYFAGNGTAYELQEDLVRSTAHELQHLINFVNHAIISSAASNPSYNGNETTFLNEGLSMLAQDFAVERMYASKGMHFDVDDALERARAFLGNPGNYSISAFTGIDSGSWGAGGAPQYNCSGGCYGGAYLFQRYLRDRFGGDGYTHAMETGAAVGVQNLQSITGEAAGALIDDFALAMAAGSSGVTSSDKRFVFGSLDVAGTYGDQFGASLSLGGAYATPLAGNSVAVHAPVGGFAFVAVPSVPSGGMPVAVTDQSTAPGFALAGGLAQH